MGFFDKYKAENAGRKAYGLHVVGNRLYDQDKTAEAKAKHEQALKLYEEAIRGGCTKPSYVMAYGVLLLRFARFEEAKELFLKADSTPGITKAEKRQLRINFAICQWKLGQLDSAISNLKIAMSEAPTGMLYGSLGYILIEKARQTGDFAEALEFNTKALDYDDEDAATLDNYGELMRLRSLRAAEQGDAEAAKALRAQSVDYYERARKAKPGQITTLYALARFAREDGDLERARELVDRAILHSGSKVCPVSLEELQALRAQLD